MSHQQHSVSLEIVETLRSPIEITQNSFQILIGNQQHFLQPDQPNDTFELSLDQKSLSFQIQEQARQSQNSNILKEGTVNLQQNVFKPHTVSKQERKPLPLLQQQRKRKRKQIFEKYKQKATKNLITEQIFQEKTNQFLNTFDEIFKIKSPEKFEKTQMEENPALSNLKQHKSPAKDTADSVFKKKVQPIITEVTSFQQIQILNKQPQNQPVTKAYNNYIFPDEPKKNFFKQKSLQKQSDLMMCQTDSFMIESSVNKISLIQPNFAQQEVSRDSVDLQSILKSQIFRDQTLQRTIKNSDTSYKNLEISALNPSILMKAQQQSVRVQDFDVNQRLGLTREKSQATLPLTQQKPFLKKNQSEKNLNSFESVQIKEKVKSPIFIRVVKKVEEAHPVQREKFVSYDESKVPMYLRQLKRRNSAFPVFSHSQIDHQFCLEQNQRLKDLIAEFKKALIFLIGLNQKTFQRHTYLKSKQFNLLNSLTVDMFLNSEWQHPIPMPQLQSLLPTQPSAKRKYDYEKVKGALGNYLQVMQYYQKYNLNLSQPKAQHKYFQIREKFSLIQKNVMLIGEDIFGLAKEEIFPIHYFQFLTISRGQMPQFRKKNQLLQYSRSLLAKLYALQQQGDVLVISQIGKFLKYKLQKIIQKTLIV